MRLVVQRVARACLTVGEEEVARTGRGVVALCGLCDGDTLADLEWALGKLLRLQLWPDADGRQWKRSVQDEDLDVLLVSQFTLYAEAGKGRKPDLHRAMPPGEARELYGKFVAMAREQHAKVQDGRFGANMQVELVNDGPVTMTLESPASKAIYEQRLEEQEAAKAKEREAAQLARKQKQQEQQREAQPAAGPADPAVLVKRLEKKLAKVKGLRARVEAGQVTPSDEQVAKLETEPALEAELESARALLPAAAPAANGGGDT